MKFIFLVQGEGRGHMTQAIELSRILNSNGHEVVHTFIGKSNRRTIPDYFFKQIESKTTAILSPNFILDKDNRSLNLIKSITHNTRYLNTYIKSLEQVHQIVKKTQPDTIINFYDFLGGFYFRFYAPKKVRHICIGRQFLTLHPDYPFESGREVEKKLYLANNQITSQRCDKYLGLSFRPYNPARYNQLVVVPPLLKQDVKQVKTEKEDFLLGYMVNNGYAENIISQHKLHPEQIIHCFWDRKDMPEKYSPHNNLFFHQINHELFTDFMRRCKGYMSTAGFESICEAMYLQKPVLMVPVDRQYEQACNAIDAEMSGAGIKRSSFDISSLLKFIPEYRSHDTFYKWEEKANSIFLEELTNY